MPQDVTSDALHWADLGDNRVGPLIREMIEALADSDDPHFVRQTARRIRLLASSLETMAHKMAETHNRKDCPLCRTGSPI